MTDRIRGMIRGGPARMVPRTGNPGPFEEAPNPQSAPATVDPSTSQTSAQAGSPSDDVYQGLSILDVIVTKALLHRGCKLPIELVEVILEQAEYWPHTTVSVDYTTGTDEPFRVYASRNENEFLIRTHPIGFPTSRHSDIAQHPRTKPVPLSPSTEHPLERLQSYVGSPDPIVTNPCRRIVFTIVSNDQGWGGDWESHGTFQHSYSWFDVGLERFKANDHDEKEKATTKLPFSSLRTVVPATRELGEDEIANIGQENEGLVASRSPQETSGGDEPAAEGDEPAVPKRCFVHDMMPSDEKLQCNLVAEHDAQTHRIEWKATDDVHPESAEGDELEKQGRGKKTGNGEFVRSLKLGDVVTVWAKARFPGWANHVRSVKVDVYWAV